MVAHNILQHFQPEEKFFIEQVRDWQAQVVNHYAPVLTPFLNPREQRILAQVIGKQEDCQITSFGGFGHSESKRVILSPQYYEVAQADFNLIILQIDFAKKFNELSHQQILGALLSTGIKRNRIGDIITDNQDWQFAADEKIADFIPAQLTQIGKVPVTCRPISNETQILESQEEWQPKQVFVNSVRLDTVISEGLNLSRDRAKNLIEAGKIKRNWLPTSQVHQTLEVGDIISVRHHGRLRFDAIISETKKGRLHIQLGILRNK